jgi:acyl carrier protein
MEQNLAHDANSVDTLKSWLCTWMADELAIDRSRIDTAQSFLSYGMDSVQAMTMVGDLEAKLGLRLPPTLAWDYPDINALATHLAARTSAASTAAPRAAVSGAKRESLLAELDGIGGRDAESALQPYVQSTQEN